MMLLTLIGATVPALGILGAAALMIVAVNDIARRRRNQPHAEA